MKLLRILTLVLSTAVLCSSSHFRQGGEDAMDVVKKVSQTYNALKSYHFEALEVREDWVNEMHEITEVPIVLAAVKPDKIRAEYKHGYMGSAIISDGKTTWQYSGMSHAYTKKSEAGGLPIAISAGPMSPPDYVSRYARLSENSVSAKILRDEVLAFEGEQVHCVVVEVQSRPDSDDKDAKPEVTTYWIDKARYLVRQQVRDTQGMMMGTLSKAHVVLRYTLAQVNEEITPSLFAYTPPQGAKQVEEISLPMGTQTAGLTGKTAPNFTLKDRDGKDVRLQDYQGKVVLMDYWATWCEPCREETPFIEKIYRSFKDKGLVVLGIDYGETAEKLESYLKFNANSLPILLDTGKEIAQEYKVESIPTVILISKSGKVVDYAVGFEETKTEAKIRAALKKEGIE